MSPVSAPTFSGRWRANQGPLVGIFLTGPGGALGRLILGIIFRSLSVSGTTAWRTLKILCGIFVLATLYFCLPEPQWRGEIIEARAVHCDLAPRTHL